MVRSIKISEICEKLELQYIGRDVCLDGLNLCNRNSEYGSILSYAVNEKYGKYVKDNNSISCLVIKQECKEAYSMAHIGREITFVISESPEITFYKIHGYLIQLGFYEKYDFPAIIGDGCKIDDTAVVQNGVVVGNHVKIGPHTVIKSGSVIDDNVEIGCNSVIGSEGFQVIRSGEFNPMHVTHVGKCHISANVYIGDNTCVCNSLFEGETFIGGSTKIDNFVQIAHNCFVGNRSVITTHVNLCGSSKIEDNVWLAPNVSVLNHVVVGKGAKVGLGSVVTRDVEPYCTVYGCPAKIHP